MIACEEYGRALFSLGEESGKTDALYEELSAVCGIFEKNPAYGKLLDTPAVPKQDRLSMLDEAFSGVDPYILNFLKILCEKRAVSQLSGCFRAYRALYFASNGTAEAVCITARPLSGSQYDALCKKLNAITGKKILLRSEVDPALIGGILLRVDGKQFDGSVKAKLDEFRRRLSETIV